MLRHEVIVINEKFNIFLASVCGDSSTRAIERQIWTKKYYVHKFYTSVSAWSHWDFVRSGLQENTKEFLFDTCCVLGTDISTFYKACNYILFPVFCY
jgi:hypothetical protein